MKNPTFEFFRITERDILSTRLGVVNHIKSRSTSLHGGAEALIRKRLLTTETPALGELIPWLLADLFNLDNTAVKEIATAWLKVYLYTCFIDDALDENKRLVPSEALAASILFQEGSATLFKLVANTRYEEILRSSFYVAAEGELLDIEEQSSISDHKIISAEKKNFVFLACAAALAAQADQKGERIIEFSEAILLGLQYLDDIADWEHDYSLGNHTKLLSDAFQIISAGKGKLHRAELLRVLVLSGALSSLLRETTQIIEKGVLVAIQNVESNTSAGGLFLLTLLDLVKSAETVVMEAERQLHLPACNDHMVLGRVENILKKIAQSS